VTGNTTRYGPAGPVDLDPEACSRPAQPAQRLDGPARARAQPVPVLADRAGHRGGGGLCRAFLSQGDHRAAGAGLRHRGHGPDPFRGRKTSLVLGADRAGSAWTDRGPSSAPVHPRCQGAVGGRRDRRRCAEEWTGRGARGGGLDAGIADHPWHRRIERARGASGAYGRCDLVLGQQQDQCRRDHRARSAGLCRRGGGLSLVQRTDRRGALRAGGRAAAFRAARICAHRHRVGRRNGDQPAGIRGCDRVRAAGVQCPGILCRTAGISDPGALMRRGGDGADARHAVRRGYRGPCSGQNPAAALDASLCGGGS